MVVPADAPNTSPPCPTYFCVSNTRQARRYPDSDADGSGESHNSHPRIEAVRANICYASMHRISGRHCQHPLCRSRGGLGSSATCAPWTWPSWWTRRWTPSAAAAAARWQPVAPPWSAGLCPLLRLPALGFATPICGVQAGGSIPAGSVAHIPAPFPRDKTHLPCHPSSSRQERRCIVGPPEVQQAICPSMLRGLQEGAAQLDSPASPDRWSAVLDALQLSRGQEDAVVAVGSPPLLCPCAHACSAGAPCLIASSKQVCR